MAGCLPRFDEGDFTAFLDALHEGVLVVGAGNRVLFANRASRQMFRRKPEDMLEKIAGEAIGCLHSEDHGCGKSTWCPCGLYDALNDVLDGGDPVVGEPLTIPIRMGDTVEVKNFHLNVLPAQGGDSDEARACVLLEDVTMLIGRTDEIVHFQEMLERRAIQCETMTEMILHDVREPLLRRVETLGASALPTAEELRADLEALALSVENLHLLSQMDPEGLPVTKEILDPVSLVTETVEAVRPGLLRDSGALDFTAPEGEMVSVSVDRRLFRLILENLFRNAVSQNPEDKPLRLAIVEGQRNEVVISVAHGGKHLPEEHLESVFDPFFHLERPGGKGRRNRGLAFCRIAARAQGGDVKAENIEDGGVALKLILSSRRRSTGQTEGV